jgi:hypothetical protein
MCIYIYIICTYRYGLAWNERKAGYLLSGSYDHRVCVWDVAAEAGMSQTIHTHTHTHTHTHIHAYRTGCRELDMYVCMYVCMYVGR